MDFIFQWLWYLLAFGAGSLLAWLVAVLTIKPRSEQEAAATLPGSRVIGGKA